MVSAIREIAAGAGQIFELIADTGGAAALGRQRQPGQRARARAAPFPAPR